VDNLYLADPAAATIQLTDTKISPSRSANVCLLVGAIDNDVLTIGTEAKTLEVRGTVGTTDGYTSSASDSVSIQFLQDTSTLANTTAHLAGASDNTSPAEGSSPYYIVWSDKSASSHTTATTDWTTGYLLKGMSDAQQLP